MITHFAALAVLHLAPLAESSGLAGKAQPARAKGNLSNLVDNGDYPADASGTIGYRLDIGPTGRVTSCTVISSSGSALLDATTCRILRQRARYKPALDADGKPTSDSAVGQITLSGRSP